jgi:hypothetical protein
MHEPNPRGAPGTGYRPSTYNGMDQGYSGTTLKTNERINA